MAVAGSKTRVPVKRPDIDKALLDIESKLRYRLDTKGRGSYASRHEIFGIIFEEVDELLDELRDNTAEGYAGFARECLDVAVAGLYGYCCVKYGYIKPVEKKSGKGHK